METKFIKQDLIRFEKDIIFKLNGNGHWVQLSIRELFNLL